MVAAAADDDEDDKGNTAPVLGVRELPEVEVGATAVD